ncbi:hypothetical protein Ga0100231_025075 [Opitutaceae bacterium TAV4]|nr:hypothetical protein Ga0100231_025075 [Opitutaceae bacterium TAV4]RRK00984.1 hypothetical protein Ga0100230_024815 [Opitutaceae bacterium TAV3]
MPYHTKRRRKTPPDARQRAPKPLLPPVGSAPQTSGAAAPSGGGDAAVPAAPCACGHTPTPGAPTACSLSRLPRGMTLMFPHW